jgi:diguanylate cyclase (GGDEF)-like protein
LGHIPFVAFNVTEAQGLLKAKSFACILMPVQGLNSDRVETVSRELLGCAQQVPLIWITAAGPFPVSLERYNELGVADVLCWPCPLEVFAAKLASLDRIDELNEQLKKLGGQLLHVGQQDVLTGLLNINAFDRQARAMWREAVREQAPISCLSIKVDHFKQYCANNGRKRGDLLLKKVAKVLQKQICRPLDLLGKAEFGRFQVLLPTTTLAGARQVAENVLTALEQLSIPHLNNGHFSTATVSIGCACCELTEGRSLDDLALTAERALASSIKWGRNRVMAIPIPQLKKVVVVDEDLDSIRRVQQKLSENWHVYAFTRGKDCLRRIRAVNPDLVLIGAKLDDMSSLAVCHALKRRVDTASIPVMLMSVKEPSHHSVMDRYGISGWLEKPLNPELLQKQVNAILH